MTESSPVSVLRRCTSPSASAKHVAAGEAAGWRRAWRSRSRSVSGLRESAMKMPPIFARRKLVGDLDVEVPASISWKVPDWTAKRIRSALALAMISRLLCCAHGSTKWLMRQRDAATW